VEIDGFRAGGKTGTSHKLDPTTRKYSKDLYLSSFVGLAPIDDPKIAVVVLIDEPHGDEHYGGKVAGPVFARIVSETLRHMAVPGDPKPESDEDRRAAADDDADADAETEIERSPELAIGDVIRGELPEALTDDGQIRVPSFVGLGAGRALDTAREYGLGVEIEGSGRVVEQFPLPGPADRAVVVRLVMSARAP
jgi:cell division protein FtsI (penicillin-binding protein 3)